MGSAAVPTLREAIQSTEPVVRREALRSLGKLRERASIDPQIVVPLLLESLERPGSRGPQRRRDLPRHRPRQPGEGSGRADQGARRTRSRRCARPRPKRSPRTASLAEPAIPALKKAANDPDDDVKREAGRTLVHLAELKRSDLPPKGGSYRLRVTDLPPKGGSHEIP